MRYRDGRAETGTDGVLGQPAAEVRRAGADTQRHPREGFKFIVDEKGSESARSVIALGDRRITALVIEDDSEELLVTLVKTVEAGLKIVLREVGAETDLPARIHRSVMIGRRQRNIVGRTIVVGDIAMI